MMEALTRVSSPARMAKRLMISSAALPKVAFSSPPTRGPVWAANSSVAAPMRPARGITPSAEAVKTSVGDHPSVSPRMARGTKISSRLT